MFVKLRKTAIQCMVALVMLLPAVNLITLQPSSALDSKDAACKGISLSGDACDGTADTKVNSALSVIVNLLSLVVGIAAVVMIVIAGFRYITSGGEASNVAAAKNTLIYAIIGIAVVSLAQFIVRFVINNAKP